MKTVRQSVFETNSSSVHSLTIVGEDKLAITPLVGEFGEFGWGYETLDTPWERLAYLMTALAQIAKIEYDDREKIAISKLESLDKFIWLRALIKEATGQDLTYTAMSNSWYPFGYIDHQSWNYDYETDEAFAPDPLMDFWSDDETTFKTKMTDFIFNNKYRVIIDNDNH